MCFARPSKVLRFCYWTLRAEHALWALDLRMNWPVIEAINPESNKVSKWK